GGQLQGAFASPGAVAVRISPGMDLAEYRSWQEGTAGSQSARRSLAPALWLYLFLALSLQQEEGIAGAWPATCPAGAPVLYWQLVGVVVLHTCTGVLSGPQCRIFLRQERASRVTFRGVT